MVRRLRCPNCGEHGWILSDEPTVAALCLRCSHRLEVEPVADEETPRETPAIEDAIAAWLSQPVIPAAPENDAVASCVSCGFEGLMPCDSPRGDTICPACLAVFRTKPEPVQQLIDCPNCQGPIEVHESDRGKTIVCPACNYFLGCVLRPKKRRFSGAAISQVLCSVRQKTDPLPQGVALELPPGRCPGIAPRALPWNCPQGVALELPPGRCPGLVCGCPFGAKDLCGRRPTAAVFREPNRSFGSETIEESATGWLHY